MKRFAPVFTLLLLLTLPAPHQAQDWLRVAPGRLADRLALAWRFKTGGPVTSSAAVADGRVFIGSGDKHVYALRQQDGRKLWSFKTGGSVEATPRVVGQIVVVGSADGALYALDARTGKLRWKYMTEDKILGGANAAPAPSGKGVWVVVGSLVSKLIVRLAPRLRRS